MIAGRNAEWTRGRPVGAGDSPSTSHAFWGYLILVGTGILIAGSQITRDFNVYGQAIALAVTLFAIYAALFWWFTQYVDHYAKLPAKLMIVAFLWGGFAATWTMGGPTRW